MVVSPTQPIVVVTRPSQPQVSEAEIARQHYEAGLKALKARAYDKALEELTAAMKVPAYQTAEAYRKRASAYEGLNRDADAIAEYDAALKLADRDTQTLVGRARAHLRLKESKEAVGDCDAALKIDSNLADAYLVRAEANRAQEKYPQVIDDVSKALELKPKNPEVQAGVRDAYLQAGQSFFATKAYDQALTFFSNRIQQLESVDKPQLAPEVGRAHAQRARAWQLRNKPGDLTNALHGYDEALQRNTDDSFSLANRGDAYAQTGVWDKAEADFAKAIALNPREFRAWYLQAHLRLHQNDLPGFRKACQGAWENCSQTKDMSEANLLVWLCSFAPESDVDRRAVLELADRVLDSKPKSYTYLNTIGAALYRAERYRDAVQRLNEAIAARGQGGVVDDWLFLALAHHRLNQSAEAQKWREKADKGVESTLKEKPKEGVPPLTWTRRVELQRLSKEMEALFKGDKQ
jgi:tetratricopeptide (TPR) repeat protein